MESKANGRQEVKRQRKRKFWEWEMYGIKRIKEEKGQENRKTT